MSRLMVLMKVSPETYEEIKAKLIGSGAPQLVHADGILCMEDIGLVVDTPRPPRTSRREQAHGGF